MNMLLILIPFVLLLVLFTHTHGKRNFEVVLESSKCYIKPSYGTISVCHVDKTLNPPQGFVDLWMHREVRTMLYSFSVVLRKKNNEQYTLFNTTNNNLCSFFEGKLELTLLTIFRDVLANAGELPKKCPLEKDFHFVFRNISVDAEKFPPYVPEASFKMDISIAEGKNLLFTVEVNGDVKQKVSKSRWG